MNSDSKILIEYPEWVDIDESSIESRLTEVINPGEFEIYQWDSQKTSNDLRGVEVREHIKEKGFLDKTFSYGNLKWFEYNQDQIPKEWMEEKFIIYGYSSVVNDCYYFEHIPYLKCDSFRYAKVKWCYFYVNMGARSFAGMSK